MTEIAPSGQRVPPTPALPARPLMRALLAVRTVLVLAAGTQLYLLSAHTAQYFA